MKLHYETHLMAICQINQPHLCELFIMVVMPTISNETIELSPSRKCKKKVMDEVLLVQTTRQSEEVDTMQGVQPQGLLASLRVVIKTHLQWMQRVARQVDNLSNNVQLNRAYKSTMDGENDVEATLLCKMHTLLQVWNLEDEKNQVAADLAKKEEELDRVVIDLGS